MSLYFVRKTGNLTSNLLTVVGAVFSHFFRLIIEVLSFSYFWMFSIFADTKAFLALKRAPADNFSKCDIQQMTYSKM